MLCCKFLCYYKLINDIKLSESCESKMSKDIRSFFKPQNVKKTKAEEDIDVVPESPDVEIKIKKRENRKKRVLSDSDEEIFSTKKKKSNEDGHKKTLNPKHKTNAKTELKEVKAADIFGSAPIKRTESNIKAVQKKTETGIHSDDDFDKSLLELDSIEESAVNHVKKESTPVKSENDLSKIIPNSTKPTSNVKQFNGNGNLSSENLELETVPIKAKKRHLDVTTTNTSETKQKKSSKSKQDINKSESSSITSVNTTSTNDKKDVFEATNSEYEPNQAKTKNKLEKSLNESVLSDEERFERKRHSAALYQKYLNRSGPKHLGAKSIPEGKPNCLKECAFLLTGVLDSFEREEIAEAITKLGGAIKNSISKKVTHVLAGDDAGPAKIAKAQDLGIKIISEDDFLELIVALSKERKSEKTKSKDDIKKEHDSVSKSNKEKRRTENKKINKPDATTSNEAPIKGKTSPRDKLIKTEIIEMKTKTVKTDENENKPSDKPENNLKLSLNIPEKSIKMISNNDLQDTSNKNNASISQQSAMWVEKYKPQSLKQIIGQHGEASNVKKLCNWLTKWYVNRKAKLPKPSPWAKNDDGGYYKAALLSGPPGVGKTTTVSLVCKELGFDMVEFNASDTRNKSLIKEQIGELLTTTSLSGYARGMTGKQAVSKKHVLVMDEVDGMAGNEDRGGLQELISLIKAASVPIICMCNERNSQKMRSLVNYCYDLRFNRPRVDQIKAAMMSVCCKEGIKVPGDVLSQLIVAANQDVRQTLNLLSMWAVDRDRADAGSLARDASQTKKDVKLGPWEAIRKVFSAEEHKSMSIHDKSDLFFYDYSLAPLFVQENYLQVAPHCPKHEVLERLSRAADSISVGDLVEARIRGSQAWSLLPVQAMYSSVIPGHAMSGHVTGQIQFPGWLGKNSRKNKMHRLCQEIHAHTRLSTSGSKSSIFLDYCTHLRDAIVTPLIRDKSDGISQSLEVLEAYHLLRDDLESLTEMSLWPGQRNPMILIDSKVKAAMTRTYNKKAMALPYAPGPVRRARAADADSDAGAGAEGEPDDEPEQDDSDPENDLLIKKKRSNEKSGTKKDEAGTSKDKPSSSKGKGKKK